MLLRLVLAHCLFQDRFGFESRAAFSQEDFESRVTSVTLAAQPSARGDVFVRGCLHDHNHRTDMRTVMQDSWERGLRKNQLTFHNLATA